MRSHDKRAVAYAAIVTLGGFVFGLDIGVIAGTFDYITAEFGLTPLQLGTVGAAPGLGAVASLMVTGVICNAIGRKKTVQLIALLYLVSAVTSALAPTYGALVAARFLGGLAFCSLSLSSMYIGEIAPPAMRGKLVAINQVNIVIGVTIAYLLNYAIDQMAASDAAWIASAGLERNAWRWMLGTEVIPALLWCVLTAYIPESPRWLMSVNRTDDARAAMARLMPADEIDGEVQAITDSLAKSETATTLRAQLGELFSRRWREPAVIGFTMAAVQPITGINAILTYAPMVFQTAGMDDPLMSTIYVGLVGLAFTIVALFLVDRLGRRPVVILGLVWCALSLGLCARGFHEAEYTVTDEVVAFAQENLSEDAEALQGIGDLAGTTFDSDRQFLEAINKSAGEEWTQANRTPLIAGAAELNTSLILFALLSFVAAFNVSIGPVMWVVFSEIFPTRVRGIAIPAAHLVTTIVNYLVQQLFPWQLSSWGAREIFLFYAACVVVGLAILYRRLPETKSKSIEEIEAMWGSQESQQPA